MPLTLNQIDKSGKKESDQNQELKDLEEEMKDS